MVEVIEDVARMASTADFGDARLTKRMGMVLTSVAAHPDRSFPEVMKTTARLEGLYRFLANKRVTPEAVLAPHAATAVARARELKTAVAIHDSTEVAPPGASAKGGFYELQRGRFGMLAHVTLLTSATEPCPLGVSGVEIVARVLRPTEHSRKRFMDAEKESRRWWTCADRVAEQVGPDIQLVHVMDREADSYEIFSMLRRGGHEFVIRIHHDRRAAAAEMATIERLSDVAAARPVVMTREVHLSSRKATSLPQRDRKHPARMARTASLEVRAAAVTLQRPLGMPANELPRTLDVNVVFVTEPNPPAGTDRISWALITTLPVETPEQIAQVIDAYRGRWLIEEFFKALKTGCALEDRPLESLKTSSTALALFVPIAVQLLQLRFLSRHAPTAPASTLFTQDQIDVVRRHAASDRRLPPRASVRHVMLAIAGFGGHLKSNGDPGWQVLGRGYLHLCELMRRADAEPRRS